MDGRTRLGREVRDRLQALVIDLGGDDGLSHAQRSLCRRAVWLELCIEHEETRIAEGGGIDIQPHTQLTGALLAIYKALGLKRQCRDVRLHDVLTNEGQGMIRLTDNQSLRRSQAAELIRLFEACYRRATNMRASHSWREGL